MESMSLSSHIATQIYGNFSFTPTAEQKKLIEALGDYLASGDESALFLINGYINSKGFERHSDNNNKGYTIISGLAVKY